MTGKPKPTSKLTAWVALHQVIVVADDTSIWVNHSTEKVELTEEGSISKEQQSMKRTCPLLGMLQQLAVKRSDGRRECVSIHCPSQTLPRQNAGTILSRMRKWALYSSAGCSEFLGGTELRQLFEQVPLKLVIWCPGLTCLRESSVAPKPNVAHELD